jgi:Holliday junction DNA helicase RuvB
MSRDLLDPELQPEPDEIEDEINLRPQSLDDYVGQRKHIALLEVMMAAATDRGEALEHLLFAGPPGLGKTTLAHVIANTMGAQVKSTSGPVIERRGDLAAIVSNLEEGDFLFIDEIHRLSKPVQEILYPAMEDFEIDIVLGQGPAARALKFQLPPFTLVGATTRAGLLGKPFRERFGHICAMEPYSVDELAAIIRRSASILDIAISDPAAIELAARCRGTPRTANRLLRRVRDFAQVQGDGKIDRGIVLHTLLQLDVDSGGLDDMDRRILSTIIERFRGGPVGIRAIAAAIGEEADTLEGVYEPFLVEQGYILRSRQGRVAGDLAYSHLGLPRPVGQGSMF